MFVAPGIWCLADVSSVSPSSEQTQDVPRRLFAPEGPLKNTAGRPNGSHK